MSLFSLAMGVNGDVGDLFYSFTPEIGTQTPTIPCGT